MSIIYIASPYTHESKAIREIRYRQAEKAMAQMIRDGEPAYSPITLTHNAIDRYDLSLDSNYWRPHNYAFLSIACELRVLKMPGWDKSLGVGEEILFAKDKGIPITYWSCDYDQWVRDEDPSGMRNFGSGERCVQSQRS